MLPLARSGRLTASRAGIFSQSSRTASLRFGTAHARYRSTSAAAFAGRTVALLRRGASFGFYSAVVLGGLAVVGVTGYYLTKELLLPSSDNQLFHKAFKMIEQDPKCEEILGTKLKAHGETTNQRNVKSRPIATGRTVDARGIEHILMQFHVNGDKAKGIAKLEVMMNQTQTVFRYLYIDVPGHKRHYIVNTAAERPRRSGGLFGIKWGPQHHAKERD